MNQLIVIVAVMTAFGVIAALIGQRKNLPVNDAFFLGLLLGVIGVAIVVCKRPGLPRAPQGMRAVTCPRCNAVQNVPIGDPGDPICAYECWQCHTGQRVRVAV